eukprot:gnl/TRDRNA2_/TRDRNA2_203925_c0_seq1.p1 gnl/TRDRNA2_/TRDRNA2_203925_c0~~gnl/TRDRNA2_/TRDRNA2_203925_c0_seq1.p1  ORF type:complete len:408 (-),score=73.62 gnl/TRDRNA2_/TRDRNA2_203925_c0_seq1:71-1261(-)
MPTADEEKDIHDRKRRPRVLLMKGWGYGPIDLLAGHFVEEVDFEEPQIPIPPCGYRWLLNPFVVPLVADLVVSAWLLSKVHDLADSESSIWMLRIAIVLAGLLFARLCLAGVVRFAIFDAVRINAKLIRQFKPDAVVAFSYGGGIAWWLLAQGHWAGPTLLVAPAARIMRQFSFSWSLKPSGSLSDVHVFHADQDILIGEAQVQELRLAGCEIHYCHDDHKFSNFPEDPTNEEMTHCFREMLGRIPGHRLSKDKPADEHDGKNNSDHLRTMNNSLLPAAEKELETATPCDVAETEVGIKIDVGDAADKHEATSDETDVSMRPAALAIGSDMTQSRVEDIGTEIRSLVSWIVDSSAVEAIFGAKKNKQSNLSSRQELHERVESTCSVEQPSPEQVTV